MSDRSIFTNLKDYQTYFDGLARGSDDDMAAILSFLNKANDAKAQWPDDFARLFQNRLTKFFDGREKRKIDATQLRLLRLALTAKLDSAVLREKYAYLAKLEFQSYKDSNGLVASLGLGDSVLPLEKVM